MIMILTVSQLQFQILLHAQLDAQCFAYRFQRQNLTIIKMVIVCRIASPKFSQVKVSHFYDIVNHRARQWTMEVVPATPTSLIVEQLVFHFTDLWFFTVL